jgi:DNA-binding NarL/FixJ family response regulator
VVDLVITDVTLPDGNWVNVLRLTLESSSSPGVLVHSRVINDRLWSEVLWRGAYDMLIAPYSSKDGGEIIKSAFRAGCMLVERRAPSLKR